MKSTISTNIHLHEDAEIKHCTINKQGRITAWVNLDDATIFFTNTEHIDKLMQELEALKKEMQKEQEENSKF